MGTYDKDLVKKLTETDPEFREKYKTHKDYETKIAKLEKKSFLNPEDTVERNRLKKMKLALKEDIERIIASHSNS